MTEERRKHGQLHWQKFGHDESAYERINQKWICGKQPFGCPCERGPDERGRCQATFECKPVKENDRWLCKRSKKSGGACENGPLPDGRCCNKAEKCTPIKSHRHRRASISYAAAILTLGILLFFIAGPMRTSFMAPGDSGSYHGSIATDCAACHSAEAPASSGWIETAMHPFDGVKESHLCLNCHNLGSNALQTHSLPDSIIMEMSNDTAAQPSLLQLAGFEVPKNENGEIACAICHQEHRGSMMDTTHLENQQCQSCHLNTFESFSDGHPDFDGYPYKARLNIKFDHVSHIKKHFPEDDKDVPCTSCHMPDRQGGMMVTEHYKEACSSCHEEQIRGEERSGERGILVFSLPGIDLPTLAANKLSVGGWQEDADGEITPFMDILLLSDTDYAEVKQNLNDVDLLDLVDEDKEVLIAVQKLVGAVKKLYVDIALKGQQAIRERLEFSLERELTAAELKQLVAMIPAELMDATLRAWLPNIYIEMMQQENPSAKNKAIKRLENESLTEFLIDNTSENEERVVAGGWYKNDDDFSIYYRPSGHADDFMQGWFNATVQRQPIVTQAVFDLLNDEKSPGVCIKCHSVSGKGEQRHMNWMTKQPKAFERTVIEFRHAAHFSVVDGDVCESCHKMDVDADFMSSYDDNHSSFVSNFISMEREACAECHVPERAGNTCLSCHNYHIGVFEPMKNTSVDR